MGYAPHAELQAWRPTERIPFAWSTSTFTVRQERPTPKDVRVTTLCHRLIERAEQTLSRPPSPVRFTGIPEAHAMLNDLTGTPHAFVLACIGDRQMSAERAWLIPQRLGERLDSFAFSDLLALPQEAIDNAMALPVPLHRFPA